MPTFNNKETKVKSNFQTISISLASPEDITERSCGEVLKPETVNYRTYPPRTTSAIAENTSVSVTAVSFATGVTSR